MAAAFVTAYSKTTGRQHRVPDYFIDDPILGADLTTETPNPPVPAVAAESAPSMEWTRADLDAYAASQGLDTSGEANKTDALAVITAHIQAQQQNNNTQTPVAGENQE